MDVKSPSFYVKVVRLWLLFIREEMTEYAVLCDVSLGRLVRRL